MDEKRRVRRSSLATCPGPSGGICYIALSLRHLRPCTSPEECEFYVPLAQEDQVLQDMLGGEPAQEKQDPKAVEESDPKAVESDTEWRRWSGQAGRTEYPSKTTTILDCPWCGCRFKAYNWSLAGGGKRCPACGALHLWRGVARNPQIKGKS